MPATQDPGSAAGSRQTAPPAPCRGLTASATPPASRAASAISAGEPSAPAVAANFKSRARAWLFAPLWLPVALLTAAMAPDLIGALLQATDHCAEHIDAHHHHLCVVHPPHASDQPLAWALPLALALIAGLIIARSASKRLTEWRLARALVAISRPSALGDDIRVLDQPDPLALTVGCRRPTALLSTGLIARITPAALDVVIAHERAHIARRDTWFALLDRFAASLLPRPVAAPLLERITLAREQACDAAAAVAAGGPLRVAQALTEVARLGMATPEAGVSVASGALEARIRHLLEPPPREARPWLAPTLAALAVVLIGAGPVHAVAEHLISFLLH